MRNRRSLCFHKDDNRYFGVVAEYIYALCTHVQKQTWFALQMGDAGSFARPDYFRNYTINIVPEEDYLLHFKRGGSKQAKHYYKSSKSTTRSSLWGSPAALTKSNRTSCHRRGREPTTPCVTSLFAKRFRPFFYALALHLGLRRLL